MSGILRLESLTKGNTLKQGDKTPLKYRLFDADGEKLNIAGKLAKVRLVYPDFLTIGYEKDGLTVAQDDTVTFTIDSVIPSRIYHVEIIVDDKFVFPSRADESKFTVDKSSLGAETNIIEVIGKDILIRDVRQQVEAGLQPMIDDLTEAEDDRVGAENTRQQNEANRNTAESGRVSAEEQRKIDHANRSAELASKADKVVLENLVTNGDFRNGVTGWNPYQSTLDVTDSGLQVTPTSGVTQGGFAQSIMTLNTQDKYYFHSKVKADDDLSRVYIANGGTIMNEMQDVSSGDNFILSAMSQIFAYDIRIRFNVNDSGSGTITTEHFIILNLTEIFGAGNEPSKEEMDKLIEVIGFIDGEYALNNNEMLGHLMKNIREKADKKQEDWITPTLLNGWVHHPERPLQYRKDNFGQVVLRGQVENGTSNNVFLLPRAMGYRPRVMPVFSTLDIPTNSTIQIRVYTTGYVQINNFTSSVTNVPMDGMQYYVDQ